MTRLTHAQAEIAVAWRYAAPYDLYNHAPLDRPEVARALTGTAVALTDTHPDLIGYFTLGPDGQVPGGDYQSVEKTLDIGVAIRPDLTGQGQGQHHIAEVLRQARLAHPDCAFRVTVAAFNGRALRVWQRAGFEETSRFLRAKDERWFVVLLHTGALTKS